MSLLNLIHDTHISRFPRSRGDEPLAAEVARVSQLFSPLTRG